MKIITIIGTRPEIIKMSSLLPLFDKTFEHALVHTNQHYDYEMDKIMFEQLALREPDYRLHTSKKNPAVQLGDMICQISEILVAEKPDFVVVHGDTNSAMAGAIAANKLKIMIAHVESGCRSFDYRMPEEFNRTVTDHLSEILFAPDDVAVSNLKRENIQEKNIKLVGSTVFDYSNRNKEFANKKITEKLNLRENNFVVATLHRQESVDSPAILREILSALETVAGKIPIVFPVHPRTQKVIDNEKIKLGDNVIATRAIGYLDFLGLLQASRFVMTDSGGVQEEAAALNKPCLILRDVTEWSRLVDAGKNFIATTKKENITAHAEKLLNDAELDRIKRINYKSDEGATEKIMSILKTYS
ncbi:MAG: UDP-N-acetylglucosamine 2-epimerase (non-hydrolyzing) [DPANN group archaeon]|nr:UDP-N-acetylglucosamine 2-epimerase (non-hydrolyzing) [DPANN group archaeon]